MAADMRQEARGAQGRVCLRQENPAKAVGCSARSKEDASRAAPKAIGYSCWEREFATLLAEAVPGISVRICFRTLDFPSQRQLPIAEGQDSQLALLDELGLSPFAAMRRLQIHHRREDWHRLVIPPNCESDRLPRPARP